MTLMGRQWKESHATGESPDIADEVLVTVER
jgi:hypothetical protein